MGQPVMMPSFAAGELSPSLFARVDLAKWHSGAALLENFFVDYRGGVSNRTGTKFIGDSLDASQPSRLIKFIFNASQAYVLVFENHVMRVINNGGIVQTGSPAADYVLATPYDAADLALLKFTQSADVMTLTHPSYAPAELRRLAHDSWALSTISFAPTNPVPANVSAVPSVGGGTTQYVYVVTAIAENGLTESLPSAPATSAASETMSGTAGEHQTVTWDPVLNAQQYNVYRQPEVDQGTPAPGQLFGFVGTAAGTSFVDANIAPDFSRTPPQDFNPFGANGAGSIGSCTVADPGIGYFVAPIGLAFTGGGGSGALATVSMQLVVVSFYLFGSGYTLFDELTLVGGTYTRPARVRVTNSEGTAVTFSIIDPGDYSVLPGSPIFTSPGGTTVPVVGGTGSGAEVLAKWGYGAVTMLNVGTGYTSTPTVSRVGGAIFNGIEGSVIANGMAQSINSPACVAYFEQRQVFAGPDEHPATFYMSKTGDYKNFSFSSPSRPDDSIIGTLVSKEVNQILHLVPLESLIALTSSAVFRIFSPDGAGPVTPSSISGKPQVFNGCSARVPPLVIGRELLYVQSKGSIVRDLSFNVIENVYSGADLTVLANHLFYGHQILEWDYAEEPFKIIYAVREDGVLLSFTFLKEQEVYAWSHHVTEGHYLNVCVIPEGEEDVVYVVVERYIQGAKHHFIERFASRNMGAIPEGVTNISSVTQIGGATDRTTVPADLSKAWFVDCGLQYPLTYPAATLTPRSTHGELTIVSATPIVGGSGYVSPTLVVDDATGTGAVLSATVALGVITAVSIDNAGTGYTNPTVRVIDAAGTGAEINLGMSRDLVMETDVAAFAAADVGAMVRVNNGWGTVRLVTTPGLITVDVIQPLSSTWPALTGEWSCTRPVSSVSGLDHLEGETVAILADGNVMPEQQVTLGAVTLEQPASAIFVGLPYAARLQTLYLDIQGMSPTVQGKRKKVSALTIRAQDTRGIQAGHTFDEDDLFDVKDREFEQMGEAVLPWTGDRRIVLNGAWEVEGQLCIRQPNPLPCTILGLMPEVSVGDS